MIDLREFFNKKIDFVTKIGDAKITHHLRSATNEEDLIFRKRSTAVDIVGRKAEPSDIAFKAPLMFYDQLCESVTVEINGESQNLEDFKEKIDPDIKVAVIQAYQNRFTIGETEVVRKGKGD